jgi:hypothetical protein
MTTILTSVMGTVRPTDRHKLFPDSVARKQVIIMYHRHCVWCTKVNSKEGAVLVIWKPISKSKDLGEIERERERTTSE